MSKFGLYTLKSEIPITITEHNSIQIALEYYSKVKNLPLKEFLKIFRVQEIKENDKTRSIKS
jgi:hypothetical protein